MLNIVCVNAGNYLGRGADYVNILFDMVCRNISDKTPFKFICFTDCLGGYTHGINIQPLPEKGLKGWWNKLALFKKGIFADGDRVIYLDLDTVIAGGLDEIIKYDGEFAILRDFYRSHGLQSSIMAWEANTYNYLWEAWNNEGRPEFSGGDQEWIERNVSHKMHTVYGQDHADIFQDLYPGCFVSYKIHASRTIPKSAKIIIFHGKPRPHEIIKGWVPKVWKIGGGTTLELEIICNTKDDILIKNIRHAMTLNLPRLQPVDAHHGHAVMIGGGPSLKNHLKEIKERQHHGQVIFAMNNTYHYLLKEGIVADCHVMLDAREENKDFVADTPICYYASQCHPKIFEKSKNNKVILWHSLADGIIDIIGENTGDALIGGGFSVGMKAIALAHTLGYRQFHLYGYDSSYDDGSHHAYKQPLNDKEKILEVEMNGQKYRAAAWMCTQVEDFKNIARLLVEEGSSITVHGTGLLPDVAKLLATPDIRDTEIVKIDGIWWPSKDRMARNYHKLTFPDIGEVLKQCGNGIAIQAGGNVGLWPKEMSKHFREVHTFEPDALNFECLMKNCPENNITAYPAALGEEPGTGSLERLSYNCGAHFIKEGDEFPIIAIDSLNLSECDLIQLDIEGFELKALRGAQKTIETCHPVIVVEDKGLSDKYGSKQGDIAEWLKQFGYEIHSQLHRDIIFIAKPAKAWHNSQSNNVECRKALHA